MIEKGMSRLEGRVRKIRKVEVDLVKLDDINVHADDEEEVKESKGNKSNVIVQERNKSEVVTGDL